MKFQQTMQPGERQQFRPLGDFLFIEHAPGTVLITTESGGFYELSQGAQIKSERLAGLMTVENKGGAGPVSLMTGFGEYVPPQRENVAVSQMPAIAFAPGQSVSVRELPAVELASGQALAVTQLPDVAFQPGQQVSVKVGASLTGSVSVLPYTVAENESRHRVQIKAHPDNTDVLTVAGAWPLLAGESIELTTTAQIELTGTATDTACILEM